MNHYLMCIEILEEITRNEMPLKLASVIFFPINALKNKSFVQYEQSFFTNQKIPMNHRSTHDYMYEQSIILVSFESYLIKKKRGRND